MIVEESFEQLNKNLGLQYDFYKHLTTISSGAVLFIAAFVHRGLHGAQKACIILAIIGFLLSIVAALLAMLSVGVQSQDLGGLIVRHKLGETPKDAEALINKVNGQWKAISRSSKWVSYSFGAAMLLCVAFFVMEIF